VVLAHGSSDDVSARGIGERVEEPVGRLIVEHIYNHLVVGYYDRRPGSSGTGGNRRRAPNDR
jgi:hypothetical protein